MSATPADLTLKDGSTIIIREATPADAAAMIDLVLNILSTSAYTLTTTAEFTYSEGEEAQFLQSYLDNPGSIFLVAELNGTLVGNLSFTNGKKKREQHNGVIAMGIRDGYRGKGIGTFLLESLLDWARQNPLITKISLEVFLQNSHAINLYRNMGFMEEGRLRRGIRLEDGEYMDLVLMYKFI